MNYYQTIQEIIDYIDKNLKEDMSIYKIAQYVNFSVPHTYRLFKAVTGETIKSYILKRRLSCAAHEIKVSKKNISDVAYEYGFESHDVFTRAFTRIYNLSPSKYRSEGMGLGIYQISINENLNIAERSKIMNYSIIYKDNITVVGMECEAKQWDADGAIGRLWSDFLDKVEVIKEPVIPNVMYGICEHDSCDQSNTFTYMSGIEVEEACAVPKGMVKRVISKQKFLLAEVPENIKTPDAYKKTFDYIKENSLTMDDNDEIEVYEEIFKDPDNHTFKLLIPIR